MRTRHILGSVMLAGTVMLGEASVARAGGTLHADVTVIHATKCDAGKIDPAISDAPPPMMGYDCLALAGKASMPLALNTPATTVLTNGRTFQLLLTDTSGGRYKVAASVSAPDGGFMPVATITVDPNRPFNVGGFAHQGGVLVLMIKIVP